jgi:hypothetical protein
LGRDIPAEVFGDVGKKNEELLEDIREIGVY